MLMLVELVRTDGDRGKWTINSYQAAADRTSLCTENMCT